MPARIVLLVVPCMLMLAVVGLFTGIEHWLMQFGSTRAAQIIWGKIGIAFPYGMSAVTGIMVLFAARGGLAIRSAGLGVMFGVAGAITIAFTRELVRLSAFAEQLAAGDSILHYVDPATVLGASTLLVTFFFGARVAMRGNAAFAHPEPRRVRGRRAIHGEATWMSMNDAKRLFARAGGIVIGEAYRVDRDRVADRSFRADDHNTWGAGGTSTLLCHGGVEGRHRMMETALP
jgi:type IV secretion system protein VirD4